MSVDLRAHFTRINAAKKAAEELRGQAQACRTNSLRDESLNVVQEALELLREIEAQALSHDCNLLPETIGRAALKAEDALIVLRGKVCRAAREAKGNLLSKFGLSISAPHKKFFKEARDGLASARAAMSEDPDALTDDEDDEPAQQQQQQQQPSGSDGDSELHLAWERGVKVQGLSFWAPKPDATAREGVLWVALNKKVELYVGCSPNNKTEIPADKGQSLTCAVCDPITTGTTFMWTGHSDGTVMLHAHGQWKIASLPSSVGFPIRSMAVDNRHCCWAGDDAGIIRVINLDARTGRLSVRMQLTPPQARALAQLAVQQGAAAVAAAVSANPASASVARGAPVLAMLGKGTAVFSSGGKSAQVITAWNSQTYQEVEEAYCDSFGAAHSFAALPWESSDSEVAAGGALAGNGPAGAGNLRPGGGAVPGVPASGVAMGYAAGPRATVPASVVAANAAKGLTVGQHGQNIAKPAEVADSSSWRLLSGHERGQVLLWHFKGPQRSAGPQRALQLLAVIGEPRPQGAVRGMAIFEDFSMLLLAHASGNLTALPVPNTTNGALPSSGSAARGAGVPPAGGLGSFPAYGVPSRPQGPGGAAIGIPGAAPHVWKPRVAQIKAHKNGIVAVASLGELLVTASNATVKSWTAEHIKVEAQGDGIIFTRKAASGLNNGQTTAAALEAAIAAADDANSGYGGFSKHEPADRAAAVAAALAAAAQGQDEPVAGTAGGSDSGGSSLAPPTPTAPSNAGHPSFPAVAAVTVAVTGGGKHAPASAAEPAGDAVGDGASSSQQAARPAPVSCNTANPMSRENVNKRGLQVDAKGTVIVPGNRQPEVPSSGWPAGAQVPWTLDPVPVISPIGALGGVELVGSQHYPPPLPPGAVPAAQQQSVSSAANGTSSGSGQQLTNGGSGGSLEATNSVQDGFKLYHVICNSELVLKEIIGSGAEGKVYRGTWTNIDIAAKEYLAVDEMDSSGHSSDTPSDAAMQRARDALRKEVSLLTSLNHPNLVRFCGVCLDPPLVVMEFYRHGNVFSMLEKARRQWSNHAPAKAPTSRQATKYMNYFTWDRRLEMLHDVAAGMMYLHKRHYVHGDLRSPNLFVGTDGRVKIGDFGFTKRLSGNKASMQVKRITHPRWVAPELMTHNRLSTASDVYSFAIIMFEMLTWQMPFHDLSKEQVVLRVMSGGRPDMPAEEELPPGTSSSTCLGNYKKLMEECWDQDPEKRPSFDKIAARLKAMIRWRLVIRSNKLLSDTALAMRGGAKAKAAKAAAAAKLAPALAAKSPSPGKRAAAAGSSAAAAADAAAGKDNKAAQEVGKAAPGKSGVLDTVDDDHDPLPVPDHPIPRIPADEEDLALPPVPAAEAAAVADAIASHGGNVLLIIQNVQQPAPAQQHVGPAAAAAADQPEPAASAAKSEEVAMSPFLAEFASSAAPPGSHKQPQQVAASGAAAAAAAAGTSAVAVPGGGGDMIVGSDVPGSPYSGYTLSTKNSTEAGNMSVDTAGLTTPAASVPATVPPCSGGTWDVQPSKSLDRLTPPSTEPSVTALNDQAAAAAAAAGGNAEPGSPPPPGYPNPNAPERHGFGSTCGDGLMHQQMQTGIMVRSVPTDVPAASDYDSSAFAGAAAAAAAAVAAAGGSIPPVRQPSSVLQPCGTSSRLDPIQEKSSEGASGTMPSSGSVGYHAAAGLDSAKAAAIVAAFQQQQQQQPPGMDAATVAATLASLSTNQVAPRRGSSDASSKVENWLTQQQYEQQAPAPTEAHGAAAQAELAAAAMQQQGQFAEAADSPFFGGHLAGNQGGGLAAAADTMDSSPYTAAGAGGELQEMYGAFAGACNLADSLQQSPQQQQPEPEVFLAEDSPFFVAGAGGPSGSVDMQAVFGGNGGGGGGGFGGGLSGPSAGGSGGPARAQSSVPAYLDPDYLDDSCLPLDDDGPRLGAALTLVYQEGLTPVDAACRSSNTVQSNMSGCTLPSLEAGVAGSEGPAAALRPAAAAANNVRPDSFSAEASPFAAANFGDLCDSTAAGQHVPISMGDSPFAMPAAGAAAAGHGGLAAAAAPATAAGGPGTAGPGNYFNPPHQQAGAAAVAAGYSIGSPFAGGPQAHMAMGPTAGAGAVTGLGQVAVHNPRHSSPGPMPPGSPGQHHTSYQQVAGGQGVGGPAVTQTDPAMGWLAGLGLNVGLHPGVTPAQADYMTGGQAPAVPAPGHGRAAGYGVTALPSTQGSVSNAGPTNAAAAAGAGVAPAAAGVAAAGSAAAAGGAAGGAGRHFTGPLDLSCLNKPLGAADEDEDLMEKAQREYAAWKSRSGDKTAKQRRTSGSSATDAVPRHSQELPSVSGQDTSGPLAGMGPAASAGMPAGSAPFAAPGGFTGGAPQGWVGGPVPMAPPQAAAGAAGYPIMIGRAGSSFDQLPALMTDAARTQSAIVFPQVHPAERVHVVNRPFTATSMDSATAAAAAAMSQAYMPGAAAATAAGQQPGGMQGWVGATAAGNWGQQQSRTQSMPISPTGQQRMPSSFAPQQQHMMGSSYPDDVPSPFAVAGDAGQQYHQQQQQQHMNLDQGWSHACLGSGEAPAMPPAFMPNTAAAMQQPNQQQQQQQQQMMQQQQHVWQQQKMLVAQKQQQQQQQQMYMAPPTQQRQQPVGMGPGAQQQQHLRNMVQQQQQGQPQRYYQQPQQQQPQQQQQQQQRRF